MRRAQSFLLMTQEEKSKVALFSKATMSGMKTAIMPSLVNQVQAPSVVTWALGVHAYGSFVSQARNAEVSDVSS
jgi:hypothetical protein